MTEAAFMIIISIPWLIDVIISKMEIEELIIGVFLNLSWCGISIYIMCCCLILFTIQFRLSIINKIVKKSLTKSNIKTISKLHMNLCELASEYGRVFAFQMTIMAGISLANSTFCFFELYFAIREHSYGIDLYFSIFATIFNLFFIAFVTLIMGTASFVTNEGEKTLAVLHEGIYKRIRKQDISVIRKLQIFLLQIQHFNVNISCGFYRLEWKIMMQVFIEIIN